jgi:sec-independent protein translocase protein TatA
MMFLKGFEGWHILIIAGLLVVLFGARKLPDSARSIGQSLRIFKSEMKAAGQDGEVPAEPAEGPDQSANPRPQAVAPAAIAPAATSAAAHLVRQDTADLDSARR